MNIDTILTDERKIELLGPFLQLILPQLGLDYDTYGSYIVSLLNSSTTTTSSTAAVTDDDCDTNDEEWNDILNLLQESSETHSDDDIVWKQLQIDVINEWNTIVQNEIEMYTIQQQLKLQQLHDQLQKDSLLAKQPQRVSENEGTTSNVSNNEIDTEAQRRRKLILDQYGYERDEDNGTSTTTTAKTATSTSAAGAAANTADTDVVINNRDYAKQMDLEKSKELRSQKVITKKEEQQKTNEHKKSKELAKEERKKRSIKGERKR